MSFRKSIPNFLFAVLCLGLILSACSPAATQAPQMPVEPATPTPEIFNPVDPSPTQSGSTLPMTCQVTDLSVYINEEWGYCFAYPIEYTLDDSRAEEGTVSLYGPPLDENADPIRVNLEVTIQPVPEESSLSSLVSAYLTLFRNVTLPVEITREPWRLGSEPGEKIEPVPGLLSSRVIMALHDDSLFTLRFHPSDIDYAKAALDALTQTMTGSFAFLDGNMPLAAGTESVSWPEFGREISLTYDSPLSPWVETQTVAEVPLSDQILFAESRPAYAQFRFTGYQAGRPYQLPLLPVEDNIAQVMVFRTADFPGYGDDASTGFVNQQMALQNLLDTGVDPARCAQSTTGEFTLPFLPWINAQQTFCAQPQILEFHGGRGVRYISEYSQGPEPVLDQHVFYTFQGLTDDGQFYISAIFPVETGIFPVEPAPCPRCSDPNYNPFPEWQALIAEQLAQLNMQAIDEFTPSLSTLDDLVQSIQIGE
jgi:hypothetical protein